MDNQKNCPVVRGAGLSKIKNKTVFWSSNTAIWIKENTNSL